MPEDKEVLQEEEQLKAIGLNSVETPDGDVVDVATPEQEVQEPQEQETQPETQETEAQEPSKEEPPEGLTEEQRRTWQSEADKAKHKAEQLEQEMEQMKLQNQQLLGLLQGSQTVATPGAGQAPAPAETKEPQLSDFIDPSQYVAYDALDPNTASGQAYIKYQRAVNRYDSEQVAVERERKAAEKKKEEVAMQQAQKLADTYPEFRDPFGRPNMHAISNFIATFSNSDDPDLWVNLYNLKANKEPPSKAPTQHESVSAIGRKANQVSTVSGQPSGEPIMKKEPKTIKQYKESFGDFFDIPEDAEGFE